MLLFWALAALLSGAAVALILFRAARAERGAGARDPALEVYRRQLGEIDEQAERGLLGPEEHKAARAEAGRRLLHEADVSAAAPAAPSAAGRRLVLAAALIAPLLAVAGYMMLGSPGFPDQPFQARLNNWRRSDPSTLGLPQMAAVLESMAARRPKDAQPLLFLARVQSGEGDMAGAARSLRRALLLDGSRPDVWIGYGEALMAAQDGTITPDAREAFRKAAALDPKALEPRYFLARADIADGRVSQGLEVWKALAAALPDGDERKAPLKAEIAETERTGALPVPPAPAEPPPQEAAAQAAFIQGMVDRLASRLKASPDDPPGWARLIRAYGVLGQTAKREAAMGEARRLFKDRPQDLKTALSGAG